MTSFPVSYSGGMPSARRTLGAYVMSAANALAIALSK
jgi:hypothetical protein